MSFDFSVNALINFLQEHEAQPELQKETGQVFIIYRMHGYEIPIFFLIRPETSLLQIVAYLPFQVPEKTLGDTARFLHLLNRDLDLPGFGMDEDEKLTFYRAAIPAYNGKIDTHYFRLYLATARVACETFLKAIGTIISGAASLDSVRKRIRDNA